MTAKTDPYHLRILKREEYPLWDDFVAERYPGLVFARTSWLASVSSVSGADWGVLAFFRGEELAGGLPLHILSRYGCKMLVPPPYTPYSGFLFHHSSERPEKQELERQGLSASLTGDLGRRFDFCLLATPPGFADLRPFYRNGWKARVLYTYILKLTSEEELRSRLDSAVKNKLNKAERHSVTVEEEENASLFFPLWEKSLTRQGQRPLLTARRFGDLFADLRRANKVRLFVARLGENAVASRIAVVDPPTVYDWLAGADPNYFKTGANQLLLWEMLKEFREEGFSHFDFCGANLPGVADFKSSFGGELESYYSLGRSFNLKGNIYRWLQGLKRRLTL